MKQSLNGVWSLRGYYPNVPMGGDDEYHIFTDMIDATVPGGIHRDLFRAGIIPNPYLEDNSLGCEWTEKRWWIYRKTVTLSPLDGGRAELVFEGLDYLAEVFINGVSYGEHENMFTPMRIDVSALCPGEIAVAVVLKGAVEELGQNGKTSETRTQKSRFGYKWDFGTRLVNIGIWQDVYVEYTATARVTEACISTDFDGACGSVDVKLSMEGRFGEDATLTLYAPDASKLESVALRTDASVHYTFCVKHPLLWYPNGMGAQPLYTLVLEYGEERYKYKVGIRRLRYLQNPGSPADALTYTLQINGRSVYIKGNNKVPLDHLYGNVSRADYEWCVRAMANENVNLVRVWGGGIIETETFYELCDAYGILVWQDFIQSSSGVEHIPSKDKGFLQKLSDAATHAVKVKRNHVSLALWTGGNELTDAHCIPATYEDENIAMLKAIVEEHDHGRLFLPTTPSGPVYTTVFTREDNHDVHSPWEYDPASHYANYNRLKLLLHSEFGISSMPTSIPLFMRENRPDSERRCVNHHHGEAWWHSYRRDKRIYGEFDDPNSYIPYSQWTQAEALRYVIETERRLAPYASGSMVWQINEPWPNCDCSNLMDYFGTPKMAYYWVKNSFSDNAISLKYDGITVKDTLDVTVCLYGDREGNGEVCTATVYDATGRTLEHREYKTQDLPQRLVCDTKGASLLLVRLVCQGHEKDYFFSTDQKTPYRAARELSPAFLTYKIDTVGEEEGLLRLVAHVENTGVVPAYFVHPEDTSLGYAILCDDAYFTLLPGQSRDIHMTLRARCGLFFGDVTEPPTVEICTLNC